MDISTLCDGIHLPPEIREKVPACCNSEDFARAVPLLELTTKIFTQ